MDEGTGASKFADALAFGVHHLPAQRLTDVIGGPGMIDACIMRPAACGCTSTRLTYLDHCENNA